jgi:hypothetical protein
MSLQPHLARTAFLLLGLVALVTFVGCQGQPNAGGKGDASGPTKKVTVDITGMT